MTDQPDIQAAMLSALEWQIELGADEAIGEAAVDRFAEIPPVARKPEAQASASPPNLQQDHSQNRSQVTPLATATVAPPPGPTATDTSVLAGTTTNLDDLAQAMKDFDGSPLKAAARNFVFCDGLPGAHLMIVGEAPGQEEDRQGKPFVGRAGQLLDKMLAAIGVSRTETDPAKAAYITNIQPWRPIGNRTPTPEEAALFLPFVIRHIQLANPKVVLAMGNTPTKALLQTTTGIKRMRGQWVDHSETGLPLLPSFHPAYLLRQPADKKLAWADLIQIRKALDKAGAQ